MDSVRTLIDNATQACQGQQRLADRLGCDSALVRAARAGRKHLTPLQAARLAAILGLDATKVLALVTIERADNPAVAGELREAFFRSGTLGAWVLFFICATLWPADATAQNITPEVRIYIVRCLLRLLRRSTRKPTRLFMGSASVVS